MIVWIAGYVVTAIAFLVCDSVWLSLTATRLYKARLGGLMRDEFAMAPAAAFYLVYVVGILLLAIAPALASGRWTMAAGRGALLGFVAYATYDLTNQATLRGWSPVVTIADLCWGTIVTAIAATIGFSAMTWLAARG
jgi:uncharacterized membrane protein